MTTEQAAGGIVWRIGESGIEVLVVRRPRYDDWAYPKGKLDDDESLIECAGREVAEETGFRCRTGRFLGVTSFTKPDGRLKQVSYWAMQALTGTFVPGDEVDAVAWVPLPDLPKRLSYEPDITLIAELDQAWTTRPDRILLIRHAQAGNRYRSDSEDIARPLSDQGWLEAEAMVGQLQPYAIDRILTSPAVRCRQTVEPLATDRGMDVHDSANLWEEALRQEVVELLATSRSLTTVLCSHGPIIAAAVHSLTGASIGIPMEKASVWIFDFADSELIAANYLAPVSV